MRRFCSSFSNQIPPPACLFCRHAIAFELLLLNKPLKNERVFIFGTKLALYV